MTKKNRRKLEALQAMANQTTSPEEAEIAREKLRKLESQEADGLDVHRYIYRENFWLGYEPFCPRCHKPFDDPIHDIFAAERQRQKQLLEDARLKDEDERKLILRRYEHGAFKGITIRAGAAGTKIDYRKQ